MATVKDSKQAVINLLVSIIEYKEKWPVNFPTPRRDEDNFSRLCGVAMNTKIAKIFKAYQAAKAAGNEKLAAELLAKYETLQSESNNMQHYDTKIVKKLRAIANR